MSFKKDALIHKLQDEKDKIKKEMKWFENFAGAMYKLDKEMYDKASKVAYEMLKIKEKE
tara:strand:+ start:450 stop:626 length:177 start_codon:yes stop_codon:yes gene_type:complete